MKGVRATPEERAREAAFLAAGEGFHRNIAIHRDLMPLPPPVAKSTVKLLVGGKPWNPASFEDSWLHVKT